MERQVLIPFSLLFEKHSFTAIFIHVILAATNLAELEELTTVNTLLCFVCKCTKLKVYLFPAKSILFAKELDEGFNVDTWSCFDGFEDLFFIFQSITSY